MLHRRSQDGPLPAVRRAPTTNPILPVADMQEAISFYERLGFEVIAYDVGYAWVKHCGWEWFHLRKVGAVDHNAAGAYLHVADADAWHAAMLAASDDSIELSPLADMPWGLREYSFTDPSGNLIRIGSPSTDK